MTVQGGSGEPLGSFGTLLSALGHSGTALAYSSEASGGAGGAGKHNEICETQNMHELYDACLTICSIQ